jgi:serine/threonine-protein kinase
LNDLLEHLKSALADRYKIERELGAGGMATVYLAHDIKHDRKVALKLLRPELAAMIGAERFLNEIKVTANLQHPHILPLHDSGEADSFLYYVMPFVEGDTLRDKIDREKQLGIEDAIELTRAVASALDYAHRQGVIHRDIKPENILLHDGQALVADFGIALAVSAAGGTRLTETGLSIGTPHYMSPEQAMGDRALDARSDVYSLGAVLYEMLTGDPPYTGSTAQAIVAQVITEKAPPVTAVRDTVPQHVNTSIAKALNKLPADRFASAADFATALTTPGFALPLATGARGASATDLRWRTRFFVAAGAAVVFLVAALVANSRSPEGATLSSYDVGLPDSAPTFLALPKALSVAPDGSFAIYVAWRDTTTELWYRSLTEPVARPIPGTLRGGAPVVSPDGAHIAFQTPGLGLRVVAVEGGSPTAIANTIYPDVTWTSNTTLLIVDGDGSDLQRLDVSGQALSASPTPYCIPARTMPDGRRLLCGGGDNKSAYSVTPGTDSTIPILPTTAADENAANAGLRSGLRGADFRIVDGEYLVYMSIAGDLRGTTIDVDRLRVGRSVTLVPGIRRMPYFGLGQFDISANGTLVYSPGENAEVGYIVRYRPAEGLDTLPAPPAAYMRYDVSEDGGRLAAAVEGVQDQELHVIDLSTGRSQILLTADYVGHPLWEPSGNSLIVDLDGATVRASPTASGAPDTILASEFAPAAFLADSVVLGEHGEVIARLDLSTNPPVIDTIIPAAAFPAVSPDGRWLAYNSAGLFRLFLSPLDDLDTRYEIAVDHHDAQWISSTDLVFSQYGDVHVFKIASLRAGTDPPMSGMREWYVTPLLTESPGRTFTVTPDAGVIYVQGPPRRTGTYLRVVPNWVEQMKRAVDEANR